jgi:polysaccharide biosynthesis transport protein
MYFGPTLRSAQQYQLPSGLPAAPTEPSGMPDFESILGTLLRRKRVLLSIFLTFFGLVVLLTLIWPKSYTATIKLIAGASAGATAQRDGGTDLPVLNALLAASSAMTPETYVDLIQQDPVAAQVIHNLRLDTDTYTLLTKHVTVKPVTNSSIIELDAKWRDPVVAAKIANEFGAVFVSRERDLIAGQATSALDYLSKQMPVAEATMRTSDNVLAEFEAAHPSVYISNGAGDIGSDNGVLAAQQKLAQTQVDSGQAQAQLTSVSAQLSSVSPTINGSSNIVQNPVTAQLQTQLAQVAVQLESARKQYTEEHPTVQALKEQKAQLEREIQSQSPTVVQGNSIVPNPVYQQLSQQAATLRSQIAGDRSQIQMLGAELGRATGASNSLPAQTNELARLQRKAKMAQDVYSALQQKFSEATVAQTTALSDVAITQPASANDTVVKPNWVINLVLGFILGLVFAVSGVFVIDFFDSTFKDEDDVQRVLPLPLLTTVPNLAANAPTKKLPWLRALTVEAFLQLVTALRYSSDKPLRTLAITSPNQGDGKTTVAMSTAIAMAEIEPKVVLIDADLRRPTLHERLSLSPGPGLSDVLVGETPLREAIQPTKYDGLFLLSSGTKVPNPVKLIHSPRLDDIIKELLKEYRAVVIDTPALIPVYDAAILGAKVDGTVLVISASVTDMPSTKKALSRLGSVQGVNMIGIVLNRATPSNGYASYYLNADSPTPLPHENGVASQS